MAESKQPQAVKAEPRVKIDTGFDVNKVVTFNPNGFTTTLMSGAKELFRLEPGQPKSVPSGCQEQFEALVVGGRLINADDKAKVEAAATRAKREKEEAVA